VGHRAIRKSPVSPVRSHPESTSSVGASASRASRRSSNESGLLDDVGGVWSPTGRLRCRYVKTQRSSISVSHSVSRPMRLARLRGFNALITSTHAKDARLKAPSVAGISTPLSREDQRGPGELLLVSEWQPAPRRGHSRVPKARRQRSSDKSSARRGGSERSRSAFHRDLRARTRSCHAIRG